MVEPIVFFNTYTLKYFFIKLDKMYSHYPKYYSDGEVPSDRNQKIIDSDPALLYYAETWLKKALNGQGVGAKTSVGYGYFA